MTRCAPELRLWLPERGRGPAAAARGGAPGRAPARLPRLPNRAGRAAPALQRPRRPTRRIAAAHHARRFPGPAERGKGEAGRGFARRPERPARRPRVNLSTYQSSVINRPQPATRNQEPGTQTWLRLAASVALVAIGAVLGLLLRGGTPSISAPLAQVEEPRQPRCRCSWRRRGSSQSRPASACSW
ncbi:MAG: hypothetical protein WKG07_03960 [Hymenobacter sp.]